MEKWRGKKLISLFEEKSVRMEKVVCMKLLLCTDYIVYKNWLDTL